MRKPSQITAYLSLLPAIYSFYINSSIKNICLLGCFTTILNHSTRGKNKHLIYSNSNNIYHLLLKKIFKHHNYFKWIDRFVMVYICLSLNDFIYLNLLNSFIFFCSKIIKKKNKKQKEILHSICHILAIVILFKEIDFKKNNKKKYI